MSINSSSILCFMYRLSSFHSLPTFCRNLRRTIRFVTWVFLYLIAFYWVFRCFLVSLILHVVLLFFSPFVWCPVFTIFIYIFPEIRFVFLTIFRHLTTKYSWQIFFFSGSTVLSLTEPTYQAEIMQVQHTILILPPQPTDRIIMEVILVIIPTEVISFSPISWSKLNFENDFVIAAGSNELQNILGEGLNGRSLHNAPAASQPLVSNSSIPSTRTNYRRSQSPPDVISLD